MNTPTLGHKARYHFSENADLERDELLMARFGGMPATKPAPIGYVGLDLAEVIGARTSVVLIGPTTVNKLASKHGMVLHYDLGLLQHGFHTGRVQRDRPRHLIFLFRDPRRPIRTLMAVIKATRDGSELLVTTYHVCTGKRLRVALKLGTIIRDDGTWL